MFEVKIENNNNNVVTLIADSMYYNGSALKITENEIFLGNDEIATDLKGTELRNYEVGIELKHHEKHEQTKNICAN